MVLLGRKRLFLPGAAFEITVPTIARASLEGQVESLRGVTENVIVGATCTGWYRHGRAIYECERK